MCSTPKTIKTISVIGVFLLLATTARPVTPPPDGGYDNGNTAEGQDALFSLTTGVGNTALGDLALYNNTEGNGNTATGEVTLFFNTTGGGNTATGGYALNRNTTGDNNTATGFEALFQNTTGFNNTASGLTALEFNTSGDDNTATGASALQQNTIGRNNTATGAVALFSNTSGKYNTANGVQALEFNTTGSSNTAEGHKALWNSTGGNNIALGDRAGAKLTTGSNNIDIGSLGVAGESNTIRLGITGTHTETFIAGISGATVAGGVGVIIDSNGQLGTVVSSARFKDSIQPMAKSSEAIFALRPVTFHYKHQLDPAGISQFGLVAEQVEKVDPDLVARDKQGKPYTVRYDAVNAMLLNEFLKEHRRVEEQGAEITNQGETVEKLQATVLKMQAALERQAAELQKVNERFEDAARAPRLVENR